MSISTLNMAAATPGDIVRVRHTLSDELGSWGFDHIDDAVLVLSELTTNAVTHAGGATLIKVDHEPARLRLVVHDATHQIPQLRNDHQRGGFGLRIVTQISNSWGWEQTATGKFVWSDLIL